MESYQWEGITQFIFPEEVGSIDEVVSVNVKPKWQQEETEDSLRLIGIYHIQSVIRFNSRELPNYSEGILIEHLEFNGNDGYFEYAYPLEVDLPKELVNTGNPRLEVSNVQFFVLDGSCCTFRWDVQCIIEPDVENIEDEPVNIVIESSSKSYYQTVELPEHIENEQYEVNLNSILDDEQQNEEEQDKIKIEYDGNTITDIRNNSIEIEEPIESIEVQQEEQIVEQRNVKEIEVEAKNELQEHERLFIHEGNITNIRHYQPKDVSNAIGHLSAETSIKNDQPSLNKLEVEEPSVIKGEKIIKVDNEKENESEDFLESLREDYTVFNVSNNIFRK